MFSFRCPPTHTGAQCETRNPRFGRIEGEDDQELTGGNIVNNIIIVVICLLTI